MIPFGFQLVFILGIGGAQLLMRSFLIRWRKVVYAAAIILTLLYSAYLSTLQLIEWKAGGIGRYLLPPHESILYFAQYVGWRFWAPAIFSAAFAALLIWAMRVLNKKYQNKFFEDDESFIAGTMMVVMGYPGILVYLVSFFLVFLLVNLVVTIISKSRIRVPAYYLWALSALAASIFIFIWFRNATWWMPLTI